VQVKFGHHRRHRRNSAPLIEPPTLRCIAITSAQVRQTQTSENMHNEKEHYRAICANLFWDAFGPEGIVALAYWYGALCCNGLMQEWTRFPLLQMYGPTGTGKDTLIEFLWKLLGRESYLGLMPNEMTPAALVSRLEENHGRPNVLIDLDSNGEGAELVNVLAGNVPYEFPDSGSRRLRGQHWFDGAALFVQESPLSLPVELQRRMVNVQLCHRSKNAVAQLEKVPVYLAHEFSHDAQRAASTGTGLILSRAAKSRQMLTDRYRLRDLAILDTHSRVMGMVEALTLVVPLSSVQLNTARKLLAHAADQQQHRIDRAAFMHDNRDALRTGGV
jgi:hypothetical protein